MSKLYLQSHVLTENLGNNSFAWDERIHAYGHSPTLTIPGLMDGTLDDVRIGEDIVFEEMEGGILRSCTGLQNFVRLLLSPPEKVSSSPLLGDKLERSRESEGVTQKGIHNNVTHPNLPFSGKE